MTIRVAKPGFSTTIQDLGRLGYAHLGVSPAGAADPLSFRLANLLVGNDENTPALEMTLLGATLEFDKSAFVAITGASCECKVGFAQMLANTVFDVPAGAILKCGSITGGARCYLAVHGGFDVPRCLGSASTLIAGHFGGLEGRRLRSGDVLHVRPHGPLRTRSLRPGALDESCAPRLLRVTKGPQQDWFGDKAFQTLFSIAYVVSEQSDRSGLRLKGEPVRPREQSELLTEGVSLGAIQVPQDGQPIILFVDQQTTGGYPKIANVIAADMHRVGQLRPRDQVRFAEVSIAEAIEMLRRQERWLRELFVS
jgi:antagonist of KipI